jgi:type II secretory pathway pseudopilin PulG
MLLLLMLAAAMLAITALAVAPNYRRSIQRDREVEMIHRGTQYERAVRLYYKQFHNYPTTIDQLENTNKFRFLRRRYKDPMVADGQWRIAHILDLPVDYVGALAAPGVTVPANANAGTAALAGAATSIMSSQIQANANAVAGATSDSTQTAGESATNSGASQSGSGSSQAGQSLGSSSSGPAETGSSGSGNVLGGGPMLGVVSKSKAEGLHSFNGKTHYNEWFFIYAPSQDLAGKYLPTGPFNPKLLLTMGSNTTTVGKPAQSSPLSPSAPTTNTPGSITPAPNP